jgi:uncharacterized protein
MTGFIGTSQQQDGSGTAVRERVAVIGSGIAGLTAAYLLQRRYDVLLFEADDRLGGHAHTHELPGEQGGTLAIDTGFIVHNARTYPNLLRLFGELGIATQDTDMSMSVRCEGCGLEYAGAKGPRGLFAQAGSLARPHYLRMLGEVKKFHRHARGLLRTQAGPEPEPTLGQFLARGGYSRYFTDHFMIPLVSAVWSTGPEFVLRYPARYLFQFLQHHGMLAVTGSPQWRTVSGGSARYVERAVKNLSAVHTATPVRAIIRGADHVEVRDGSGAAHLVDRVVLATHPDQALRMLADATATERAVLGAIGYSRNETVLHTDAGILPRSAAARSSWNYLVTGCSANRRRAESGGAARAVVSYDMNRLHRLSSSTDYVVTLNGSDLIDPGTVLARMVYEHPLFTPESVGAQSRLPELTTSRTAFAGAYHGWGFHEDGCASGVAAAAAFGVAW